MELTTVWFVLIAVLWTGYFCLEGFDFGVGMLFPVLGTTEKRRRVLLNTIGPVWDGNEVWLITAGGATFAAFPHWYATMFSGFYLPLLLILVALIVRALGFEYRHKRNDDTWRQRWDWMIIAGSVVVPFIWGVTFTNIVRGIPINADREFTGSVLTLLNPAALFGGLALVAVCLLHGLLFVALKTDGEIRSDARTLAGRIGWVAVAAAAVLLVVLGLDSGSVASWIMTALAAVALVAALLLNARDREGLAFTGTFLAIGLAVASLFVMLFPDVMPSSTNAAWSLTVDNAASSHKTLGIMTWVGVLFLPIVLLYQGFTYWTFRKRITTEHIPPAHDERDWAPRRDRSPSEGAGV
ncbi:cytochrome d ubiquinol oxidase subunit II [Luteipulveratus halotolerans]|uniref:Cytochrome C oxidase assembly protein n=1 Tax=Luteipulveratus halotolerans TaxID=1631356 RepID=A0A0L6CMU7_9MICO|nr:cytochrome d ubiquinol oxidase subunit II [Luteipulveratus halotolerans]KNX39042.1 cytochrome C oxidase assembly protein [Luteipulveratus halotolerans]